uniref:Uncharacterized protein n=1 Tax=Lygus hesperus TaxID=30085 RepID=A0A0A9WTU6_LYGHE
MYRFDRFRQYTSTRRLITTSPGFSGIGLAVLRLLPPRSSFRGTFSDYRGICYRDAVTEALHVSSIPTSLRKYRLTTTAFSKISAAFVIGAFPGSVCISGSPVFKKSSCIDVETSPSASGSATRSTCGSCAYSNHSLFGAANCTACVSRL